MNTSPTIIQPQHSPHSIIPLASPNNTYSNAMKLDPQVPYLTQCKKEASSEDINSQEKHADQAKENTEVNKSISILKNKIKISTPREVLAQKIDVQRSSLKGHNTESSEYEIPSEFWEDKRYKKSRFQNINNSHHESVIEQGVPIDMPQIQGSNFIDCGPPSLCSLDNFTENDPPNPALASTHANNINSYPNNIDSLTNLNQEGPVNSNPRSSISSNNEIESDEAPTQQEQAELANINEMIRRDEILNKTYKSRLRGLVVIFLTILIGSFFVPYVTQDNPSFQALLIISYIGLTCFGLETFYRVNMEHVHRWQKIEEFFKTLDVISVIAFLVVINITLTTTFNITKIGVIPHFLFTFCYYFATNAPQSIKGPNTVFRFLFSVQLLLISVRLDNNVGWSWKIILCLFWLCLGIIIFYFILLCIIQLAILFLACYNRRVYDNMDRSTQFFGHVWNLGYVGLGGMMFATFVLTAVGVEDKNTFDLSNSCIIITRYIALFLVLYTFAFYKYILPFLKAINNEEEVTIESVGPTNPEKRLMTVQVEKQIVNLVKVSSTYFLSLKDSFTVKDKSHITELKNSIRSLKEEKFKGVYSRSESDRKRKLNVSRPLNIEEFKKDQERLEEKLQNIGRQTGNAGHHSRKKSGVEISFTGDRYLSRQKDAENVTEFSVIIRNGIPICLSDGDLEKEHHLDIESDSENNTCFICVQKPCDAVIMNCGHGGVCYECALEFVKKKNMCMQCRRTVDRVVKINPDPKLGNIIKGYESAKFVFV